MSTVVLNQFSIQFSGTIYHQGEVDQMTAVKSMPINISSKWTTALEMYTRNPKGPKIDF